MNKKNVTTNTRNRTDLQTSSGPSSGPSQSSSRSKSGLSAGSNSGLSAGSNSGPNSRAKPQQFAPQKSAQQQSMLQRVILSCMIGNALEWYEFTLYAYFAPIIGKLFFPATDKYVTIMLTYGVFAAGFIMRPVGSIFFGHFGDKHGRKSALLWSIYMMIIPTTLLGVLPTYYQIGYIAPLILVLVRLLQGFSLGGEFTGSMIFIVEHSPKGKRGFYGSWAPFSLLFGVVVGSGIGMLTSEFLSPEQLASWGWRIPFIMTIFGGGLAIYMRNSLIETELFETTKKSLQHVTPLAAVFKHHLSSFVLVLFVDFLVAIGFFIIVTYVVSYLPTVVGLPLSTALVINTCSMLAFLLVIPFSGWLSDLIGRKSVMIGAALLFVVLGYPLFIGLSSGSVYTAAYCHLTLGVMMGMYYAPISAILCELFTTDVRYSGLSIAHNLSMAIFGGTALNVSTEIIKLTQDKASPGWYLSIAALLSVFGLLFVKDKYREDLR